MLSRLKVRWISLVNKFRHFSSSWRRRKDSPPPRDREVHPEWGRRLAVHREYRDLLRWVWQERDNSINRIMKEKKGDNLRSLQGELLTVDRIYSDI